MDHTLDPKDTQARWQSAELLVYIYKYVYVVEGF